MIVSAASVPWMRSVRLLSTDALNEESPSLFWASDLLVRNGCALTRNNKAERNTQSKN